RDQCRVCECRAQPGVARNTRHTLRITRTLPEESRLMIARSLLTAILVVALPSVSGTHLSLSRGVTSDVDRPGEAARREQLARDVTIYRDRFGIPHVFAKTDAGAVFGFAYAQAEDNFPRLEDDFIGALGRAAEVGGARELDADRLNRALEI